MANTSLLRSGLQRQKLFLHLHHSSLRIDPRRRWDIIRTNLPSIRLPISPSQHRLLSQRQRRQPQRPWSLSLSQSENVTLLRSCRTTLPTTRGHSFMRKIVMPRRGLLSSTTTSSSMMLSTLGRMGYQSSSTWAKNASQRTWHYCMGGLLFSTATVLIVQQQQEQQAFIAHGTITVPTTVSCELQRAQPDILLDPTPTSASSLLSSSSSKTPTSQPRNVMIHRMRSLKGRGLNEKYRVDWHTVLGEGAYGSVHPARVAATGEKVALKKISRHYTNSSAFKTETDALLRIFDNGGHPNISGLRDMYEDQQYFYLILDLVSGGEMFEHLIHYGAYSEADAARLMHEIASALAFLHGVGVVHADLKPENLLLSTKNRLDGTIKIIDFGCANVQQEMEGEGLASADRPTSGSESSGDDTSASGTPSASSTGTTAYWPRERFVEGAQATAAMDMWSVGVILYIMLTGVHPFDVQGNSTDEEIERRIMEDPSPPMDSHLVGHLSESAKDLIRKLMEPDPAKRLLAYDMLQHPWVRGKTALTEKIKDSDKKLSRFKDLRSKLEAGMFAVLVSQGHSDALMSEAKVKRLVSENDEKTTHIMQRAFAVFDAEGKGFVTSDDLGRVASERTGQVISASDTKEFLASQNGDSSAPLSLSQFNKLFSGLNQRHYPRGHYIFHAGEKGDAMYFLSSGKVEIQTRKGQLVAILRSGDFFGEGSLLDEDNRRFTSAKCTTPVDVIEIKREDFDRYIGASAKTKTDLKVKWRARSLQYAKNLLRLQKNVKLKVLKYGDVVYREGDTGTSMFRVDDDDGGVLEVSHGNNVVHKYYAGDSFGESSLLFKRPRSSTVTCASEICRVHEMEGEDFQAVVEASPDMAASLRNMCRKRLFKRAVKQYSLSRNRSLSNEDLKQAFHEADTDKSGSLNLDKIRTLMHRMDPNFPMDEIIALLKYVDVDEDGLVSFEEYMRLFRQFEEEKEKVEQKEKEGNV